MTNIDSFMSPFLQILWQGVTWVWNIMESIEFGGTNFLHVMIAITILGVALPVLLSMVNNISAPEAEQKENYTPKHSAEIGRKNRDRAIAVSIDGERRMDRYK